MFERLGLVIRLRDPWEAVDLGFILLRTHWRPVMAAWLAVALPVSAALFALFWNHLWVPPLVIWWLQPALDRIVLHVLAKATFGEIPSLRETLRHSPRLLRRGLLASLFWRRFSPQRSFVLPVWQLEEQPGAGFRKRCRVLLSKGRTQAIFLTLVCLLFQLVVFCSLLAALSLFTPAGSDFELMSAVFGSGSERVRWVDVLLGLLPIATIALLEPYYVAGGFALYLNRRVELEGWDLEVAFRKTAARITKALGRGVAIVLLACSLFAPRALQAKPSPEEALAEVLKDPEFQVKQRKKGLHWKDQQKKKEPENSRTLPDLRGPLKLLATLAKWVLISVAVSALAYVLWRNRKHFVRQLRVTSDAELPETLFGLDIRPESLPAGLEGVAAELWAAGRIRAALALLYRGALAHLMHRCRAPLAKGSTEGDCLKLAKELLPLASADYFEQLTRTWLKVAYADLQPPQGSESLCLEWPRHFQGGPGEVRR
jgi:hypothetical protein